MMVAVAILGTLTVAFLVTTLVFVAKVQKLTRDNIQLKSDLDRAVRADERDDRWNLLQQMAGNQGVVRYLDSSLRDTAEKVTGSRRDEANILLDRINASLDEDASSLIGTVDKLRADNDALQRRLEEADASSDAARSDLQAAQDAIGALRAKLDDGMNRMTSEVDTYKAGTDEYRAGIEATRQQFDTKLQEIQGESDATVRSLETEIGDLESKLAIANDQLRTLRIERGEEGLRPQSEATLVDGRVIGLNTASNEVSIDLGRRDHVVLGLTFEIYPGDSTIRPGRGGRYPTGKASVEIMRIDVGSSVGRIIRRQAGNPILVGDSVANAVYDPSKVYSFAVFGNFDTNNDGLRTPQERQSIKSLIAEWGGDVSEDVQGDTDFIVLGSRPVLPPQPRPSDPVELIQSFLLKKQTVQKYDEMFKQAEATGIPVLNQNRLYTLTGLRGRR